MLPYLHHMNTTRIFLSCRFYHFIRTLTRSVSQARAAMSGVNESPDKVVQEGKADVLTPKSVFYNPVQEFNRDLTIAVISEFVLDHFAENREKLNRQRKKQEHSVEKASAEPSIGTKDESIQGNCQRPEDLKVGEVNPDGVRILEGLSASGLRSIRFGLEIPGVREIIANDFDENAVSFIEKNISRNNLVGLVKSNCADAAMVMYQHKSFKDRFDVIDLDPYGSPSVFLDSVVQAVRDGGLLCLTCTDMAVMCGNASETCFSKYGSVSLKAKFCHEQALRIILQSVESAANRYSRYIEPVLSLSVDFYVRVFVKVYSGQIKVKESASKLAYMYHCTGCGSFLLQRVMHKIETKGNNFKFVPATGPTASKTCNHCGSKQQIGGPIWAEPIHDKQFVHRVLKRVTENPHLFGTSDRITGMLSLVDEELEDVPLYYKGDELCSVLHCTPLSMVQFRSALLNAGYRASLSHALKNSYKTDAPGKVIWDIMRAWVKDHPVKECRLKEGTPAKAILNKESSTPVSFDIHPEANPKSREKGLLRFQINPEPNWGPKPRAKKGEGDDEDKRQKLQGKRKERQSQGDASNKQYPCKKYKLGECQRGEECCYSHDVQAEDKVL